MNRPDLIAETRARIAKLFGIRPDDVGKITITETVTETTRLVPRYPTEQEQAQIRVAEKIACMGVSRKEVG